MSLEGVQARKAREMSRSGRGGTRSSTIAEQSGRIQGQKTDRQLRAGSVDDCRWRTGDGAGYLDQQAEETVVGEASSGGPARGSPVATMTVRMEMLMAKERRRGRRRSCADNGRRAGEAV